MSCCKPVNWKRLKIPDHKFDYIDLDDFKDKSIFTKIRYSWIFLLTLKSILVYMADIGIIILTLININKFQRFLQSENPLDCPWGKTSGLCNIGKGSGSLTSLIPFPAWITIIFSSIVLSFILLALDWHSAARIIKSKDISFSLTSTPAYRYYCIQRYSYYCLFDEIKGSRRTVDILAFYVFFAFKGWKRLLIAQFPRQLLFGFLLVDIIVKEITTINSTDPQFIKFFVAIAKFVSENQGSPILLSYTLLTFSVLIWIISFISLLIAFGIYIPILIKIRGNLKEYCVHKIDKRLFK